MTTHDFLNEDLETFAEYMGFNGIDSDLFYESYYQMTDGEYDDYESHWDEITESIELW